jgi:hypothetical protein
MKKLRVSLAAALILTGLALTSILHSQTRRLTARENAAIGACASRYYVCNGHCQNSPPGEARTNCEAECLRVYNACVEASVPAQPPTDLRVGPSPSGVAPATPTPMPRNISPQRGTGAATTTTTPVATIAPRGVVVPKQAIAGQTPTPTPRNISPQRATGATTNTKSQSSIPAAQGAPRGGGVISQPIVAARTPTPTPTPTAKPLNYSRRPIGGVHRTNPTPTISPQGIPRDAASIASPPSPTPIMSPHRPTSGRKTHHRHRSKEASPTPAPTSTSQPTPET